MKAAFFKEHGGAEKIEFGEQPDPKVNDDEVLIRVKACALNHLDIWVRRGWPGLKLVLPHILGSDGAGVVADLGEGVTGIELGTRCVVDPGVNRYQDNYTRRGLDSVSPGYYIIGEHAPGFHAEYTVAPAANILPLPDGQSFASAAAASLA